MPCSSVSVIIFEQVIAGWELCNAWYSLKDQTHLKNLSAFPARFLSCLIIQSTPGVRNELNQYIACDQSTQ